MRCRANGRCGIDCSGTPHNGCGCLYIYPNPDEPHGACICECYCELAPVPKVKITIGDKVKTVPINQLKFKFKTTPQTKLDICMNKFPAAALAQILDKILPNRILIPASKANAKITKRSTYTISSLVKSSGFILKR